jgi:hypothetical protein
VERPYLPRSLLRVARVSLQIKNVASILLAATASACSGITVRELMDSRPSRWWIPAGGLALALACQIALIFVESKEEEELSLLRTQRLDRTQHIIDANRALSVILNKEIEAGNYDSVEKWIEVRRKINE